MPKSCPPPPLAAPRPRARLYTHLALAQTHIHPVYSCIHTLVRIRTMLRIRTQRSRVRTHMRIRTRRCKYDVVSRDAPSTCLSSLNAVRETVSLNVFPP